MLPGTKLGPYEIVAPIGSGGMGTVYRARDSRLGRSVAIKIAAERFSDRFEREAQAIAALNHPHICTLHDVGPDYLVMELVEGPTLADRITQGPIPLDESLRIAMQIAAALDAAHARGIVHRDLKPANIKITPDGTVKVLDFGLAKTLTPDLRVGPTDADANSPTVVGPTFRSGVSQAGMIVGTAAYMAPEQARGQAVDRRADIWAFGVVLYEMLTGRPPFGGQTTTDTLASVLTTEPAWDEIPARVQPLLRRCLERDAKKRLRDIGDLDLLLGDATPGLTAKRSAPSWRAWAAAALLLIVLGPVAVMHLRERTPALALMRFQIPPTVTLTESGNLSVSPDGRYLAFLGVSADGIVRVWLRSLDSIEVRPLVGSEHGAHAPPFFWSADSRFIAFDAGGKLRKLNVAGGPAHELCDLPAPAIGGTWNRSGDILVGNVIGGIQRVSDIGSSTTPVTALDPARKESGHLMPTFLPDGRHFVYVRVSRTDPNLSGIYVGNLDAKPDEQSSERLLPYATGLTYARSPAGGHGRLLFVREGTLVGQPFDERRLELAGDQTVLAEQVGGYLDGAYFSASQTNTLVYRSADPTFPIAWFDRQGTALGRVSEPGQYVSLALSPAGKHAVAARTNPRNGANADLWLFDLARGGSPARFTFNEGLRADFPIWSADGERIAYWLGGPGGNRVHQKSITAGAAEAELVVMPPSGLAIPNSWSAGGRYLLYAATNAETAWDLWAVRVDAQGRADQGGKPIAVARTRFNEDQGKFSPDGGWIAYVSNESGSPEVYVRAFAGDISGGSASAGPAVIVSKGGGTSPRWRGDGKEIVYLAADGRMMAVDVATAPSFRAGTPTPLFQTLPGTIVGDVTDDGKKFLLVQRGTAPFTVALNWMRE